MCFFIVTLLPWNVVQLIEERGSQTTGLNAEVCIKKYYQLIHIENVVMN